MQMNEISEYRAVHVRFGHIGHIIDYRASRITALADKGFRPWRHASQVIRHEKKFDSCFVLILDNDLDLASLRDSIASSRRCSRRPRRAPGPSSLGSIPIYFNAFSIQPGGFVAGLLLPVTIPTLGLLS
jgi:hypothetical protein